MFKLNGKSLELDSARKAAFESELSGIQDEIERLKQYAFIPEHLPDIRTTAQINALGVMEAMMDLVGQQLSYLSTFAAKFGEPPGFLN